MTRLEFVTQARTWLGTPFHHQARLKGVGVDCIGLLTGVAAELGMDVSNVPSSYSRAPDVDMLFREIAQSGHLERATEPAPGDVVFFRVFGTPTHFGLMTEHGFMHADASFGVVEVPFDGRWKSRVIGFYKIKMLEDA